MKAGPTLTTLRRPACWLLGFGALVLLFDRPSSVAAQEPPSTLPPVLAPAGSDACSLGGLSIVILGAVAGQADLDLSALRPVEQAVVDTCAALPAPTEPVICSVDNELANATVGVPLPVAVPVPLPPPTPFGTTLETMRALAVMLEQSPEALDFVGSFLGCKTITGPPAPGPAAPTAPPQARPAQGPATQAPAAVPTGGGYTSFAPTGPASGTAAPQLAGSSPVSSSFPSIPGPNGAPAANASLIVLALTILGASAYAWRRAGRDVELR